MEGEHESTQPETVESENLSSGHSGEVANYLQKGRSADTRRAAINISRLLDSPPEPEFDRITRFASRLLGAPTVVLAVPNEHREFFKSAVGLTEPFASSRGGPLHQSFCEQVITTNGPLIIEDAREHPIARANQGILGIGIAYLGVPIYAPSGPPIASFCVIDDKPRRWTEADVATMKDLAATIATEIALRLHLEESRRVSNRFQQLVNVSPAVLYLLDVDERCGLFVSRAAAELVGRTPEEIIEHGAEFLPKAMHPDDFARWSGYYIQRLHHLRDGETVSFECRMLMPDGSWRWILTQEVVFSRDRKGAVRQVLGSAIDITARKETERALRESEQRLEVATTSAELGMWDWDIPSGRVAYSERWAAMLGYTLDEIEPHLHTWERLIHSDDKLRVLNEVDAHLERQKPLYCVEHRLRAKDGTWKWILSSGKVLERDADNRPLRAAGIHLDITDQKVAEAAAHAADHKLARILESMKEACASLDADWRYTFINPQWEALFGWQREKVIGQTMWQITPDVRGTLVEENVRKAMIEKVPVQYEFFLPAVQKWLEVRSFPAADGGLNTFVHDIHQRKLAEAALREQDRRKDEFIAMLGHELRNPLAALRHALAMCNANNSEETFLWAKGVAERQSAHLSRLVDQLLDVSRIAGRKIDLRKQRIDVAAVLDSSLDESRPLIVERRHEITASYQHDVLWVDGDPDRLEQVFSNLLNNAAKYTEPGGHIWIEARREDAPSNDGVQQVVISVRDSGIGIQPDRLAQMFDVFVQGERSLARSEGGLGLGLTIVRALTEMHGGTVTAQSSGTSTGSIFTVHLPAATAPKVVEAADRVSVTEKGDPHRVLVVDDMVDTVEGLARLLRRQGHTVATATDGVQACEQAHTFAPEVILLDIGMPGMNGYEVAHSLRKDHCCARAFMVALTGYGQEEDRRRAADAGFDEHLVKPVDIEQLKQLVATAPHQVSEIAGGTP